MSAIALGPPPQNNQVNNTEQTSAAEFAKPNNFVDEVYIDDQNVLSISVEKMLEEQPKRVRKSRWGAKPEKKTKQEQNFQFDPLEAMMNRKAILPMNPMNALALNSLNPLNQLAFTLPGYTPSFQQPVEEKISRWGPEYEKTFQPPSLNAIPFGLSIDNLEYIIRLYCLDEVYQKLQRPQDNKAIEDKDLRSPSPEPIYDAQGKRVNTRELRRKDNLIKTKTNLIEECMKLRKTFVPPNDYRPLKRSRKIYLTDAMYTPDINYIGLIIGPKGSTQKMLETKSGCKISIRGKGASKTKRVEFDSDDKLHVLIQADADENLDKGIQLVEKLLRGEDEDEFKKNQRLQLQVISGVLRDDFCELCHEKGHRSWACPSKLAWAKANVKCDICGERSHPTSDCPKRGYNRTQLIQDQYNQMMKEVNMNPVQFQNPDQETKERINFITEASFTGFNLQKQLMQDPEYQKELKMQQDMIQNDAKAQAQAIANFTLNKPEFKEVQQQALQELQQQKEVALANPYVNYNYNAYQNTYMQGAPMMYYGYNYGQYGAYGNSNQLQLTNYGQQQPIATFAAPYPQQIQTIPGQNTFFNQINPNQQQTNKK